MSAETNTPPERASEHGVDYSKLLADVPERRRQAVRREIEQLLAAQERENQMHALLAKFPESERARIRKKIEKDITWNSSSIKTVIDAPGELAGWALAPAVSATRAAGTFLSPHQNTEDLKSTLKLQSRPFKPFRWAASKVKNAITKTVTAPYRFGRWLLEDGSSSH